MILTQGTTPVSGKRHGRGRCVGTTRVNLADDRDNDVPARFHQLFSGRPEGQVFPLIGFRICMTSFRMVSSAGCSTSTDFTCQLLGFASGESV